MFSELSEMILQLYKATKTTTNSKVCFIGKTIIALLAIENIFNKLALQSLIVVINCHSPNLLKN